MVRVDTPEGITNKLEKAFKEALKDEKVNELFRNAGCNVENLGAAEAALALVDEYKMRLEVAKKANIIPQ
jgi:tripartite-type tricarboxylate transporter receptor subunit TctC